MAKTKDHISLAYIVPFHKVTKSKSNMLYFPQIMASSWRIQNQHTENMIWVLYGKILTRALVSLSGQSEVYVLLRQLNMYVCTAWIGDVMLLFVLLSLQTDSWIFCGVVMVTLCSYSAASITVEQPLFLYFSCAGRILLGVEREVI